MKVKLAVVVSEFNRDITCTMLEEAKNQASKLNIDVNITCFVPGVFDMPLMIKFLLQNPNIDAIVTLGAVIKGDTNHDIIVAENTSRLIADLSLQYNKPVVLGISGPNMTMQQAFERAKIVPIRAVNAAVNMVTRLKQLQGIKSEQDKSIIIK